MKDPLSALLRPHDPQPASGRVAEFRQEGGQLQQLGPDGAWHRYVPFADLREELRRTRPPRPARPAPPAPPGPTVPTQPPRDYRCTSCGRRGHDIRACPNEVDPAWQELRREKARAAQRESQARRRARLRQELGLGPPRPFRCTVCGRSGHSRPVCPEVTEEVTDGHAHTQQEGNQPGLALGGRRVRDGQPPGRDLAPADEPGAGRAADASASTSTATTEGGRADAR